MDQGHHWWLNAKKEKSIFCIMLISVISFYSPKCDPLTAMNFYIIWLVHLHSESDMCSTALVHAYLKLTGFLVMINAFLLTSKNGV